MITINLFDNAFNHLTQPHGVYSCTDNRVPRHVRYVRNQIPWDGISVFTDDMIYHPQITNIESKYKFGWLIEPPENAPHHYQYLHNTIDNFDLIMTHNKELCEIYPQKCRFVPFGGSWILPENYKIWDKTKLVSTILSSKQSTSGHKLRHQIAQNIQGVDLFGSGTDNPFEKKDDFLPLYMFNIVVENSQVTSYFTEKLLDCFAVGTIPIYWGCPDIDNFFDIDGILRFQTPNEFRKIVESLSPELYQEKIEAIKHNLDLVKKYDTQENIMYDMVYKPFCEENNIPFENIDQNDQRTMSRGGLQSFWLHQYSKDGGDEMVFQTLEGLDENSIVFDVGSYLGDFGITIQDDYNCHVYSFEPVREFYDKQIKEILSTKIIVLNFGLGSKDQITDIYLSNDDSSRHNYSQKKTKCEIQRFKSFIRQFNIPKIDLLAINIEGDEYELLEHIIKEKLLDRIDGILVQFHYINDYPHERRDKIRQELQDNGFGLQFDYPFVWEYWRKK